MSRFFQKLELHGFKSFANKTTMEFLDGITVVVGPNGCGKSNVLDSIRWVLGETSAKSLRGGRMGDVVFRGSASQKAAGFSQVTLTCNNTANQLKLDHDEVMVGRRLFSNGDSNYFINKQNCRMRDVHDLFLDTGLGADGYSIIEQGRISDMVAAKPEQRREIFEEAAGISRYKARRAETMRKLLRTEEDLLRLFDHVSEVEKTASSLYRQARKAERHRRYQRRLRRLQKRLLLIRHQTLSVQFTAADERQATARVAFDVAATKLAQAEAAQAETARRLEAFQRELAQLQEKRFQRQSQLDREKHRGEMIGQRRASIEERIGQLAREIESSSARSAILEQTLTALEADARREAGQLQSEDLVLAEETRAVEALRKSLDSRSRAMHELRVEMAGLEHKRNILQNDRRLAQSLIEKLAGERANQDTALAELTAGVASAEADLERHKTQVELFRTELTALREEQERVKTEIGDGDRSKNELRDRLQNTTQELHRVASRLQALQELEDSYEGYYRGVKEVLVASQKGRLQGIIGVVSNLVEVPKEIEIAIEVALGSDVQDIITERVDHAKAAINFLKDSNFGRATFLPLDFLHADFPPLQREAILRQKGVIGMARELVKYDRGIETAVRYLFGNTVVVENLDIAVNLEREGHRTRYVSLTGDIVNPRGVMSGGSHKTRGLLSRARDIQDLRAKKAELQEALSAAERAMQEQKDRLGVLYARSAELQAKVHETQMAEARAEKDLQASETARRERRNALASAQARATQQNVDLRRHEETIANASAALLTLDGQITALQQRMDTELGGHDGDQLRLHELSEKAATHRAEVSAMRERVRSMEAKLADLRTEQERSGSDSSTRATERSTLQRELAQLDSEREQVEEQTARLVQERDAIDAEVSRRTQENEELLREGNRMRSELQGLVRDRNNADNAFREVELQVTELRVQLEYVAREATEEFESTIEAIAEELSRQDSSEDTTIRPMGENDGEEEAEPAEKHAEELEDEQVTDPTELRRIIAQLREKIARMGLVNEAAIEDYGKARERLDFLTAQRDDLVAAKDYLRATIEEIDQTTTRLFNEAYETIRKHFIDNFRRLFRGGTADLILVPCEDKPEPGIEIFAQPPGKNIGGSITLMSGGEKAMTAIALMFALFRFRPSPICILDEVDAPLDDANVGRFCDVIRDYSASTQFLVITHNKLTMGLADTIYGVTMQEPGVSKLVSVKFDRIDDSGLLQKSAG